MDITKEAVRRSDTSVPLIRTLSAFRVPEIVPFTVRSDSIFITGENIQEWRENARGVYSGSIYHLGRLTESLA